MRLYALTNRVSNMIYVLAKDEEEALVFGMSCNHARIKSNLIVTDMTEVYCKEIDMKGRKILPGRLDLPIFSSAKRIRAAIEARTL